MSDDEPDDDVDDAEEEKEEVEVEEKGEEGVGGEEEEEEEKEAPEEEEVNIIYYIMFEKRHNLAKVGTSLPVLFYPWVAQMQGNQSTRGCLGSKTPLQHTPPTLGLQGQQ